MYSLLTHLAREEEAVHAKAQEPILISLRNGAVEASGVFSNTRVAQGLTPIVNGVVSKDNDYRPDDDEFVSSGEDEEDADPELDVTHATFDLLTLEIEHDHKPVFTRNMLRPQRPTITVWKAAENANSITVHYMTHVELWPSFQTQFSTILPKSTQLPSISTPYLISSYRRIFDTTNLNPTVMTQWRAKLQHTQHLWTSSTCCAKLIEAVCLGAAKLTSPVTKIHMSVFSIATCLDAFNKTKWPTAPPVQIVAQDPWYEVRDRPLLQELTSSPIKFGLSDLETLLSIDSNTLVVSAFMPIGVPLMQIIAEMFAASSGPAMMLWYCLRNRDAPGVARFLGGMDFWLRDDGGR
ncbi:hypothetical protein CC86DRAFT_394753 [Ophiobolus disseminans]|uniref:SRR1-like domain-containing protein n=1 Tax=Ophiobolus disseminans TaxID=1469910 RepID=A0A6A6ZY79_9PLEO|nr:hypothetical protein CC86DRAFT_394753 [Ophiobolus disseminans]